MNVHQSNLMRGMMLIGGELVPSEGGEWLESVNPATEETLGHVPHGTAADVNQRLRTLGFDPVGNSPTEFAERIRTEGAKWDKVAKEAKIVLE